MSDINIILHFLQSGAIKVLQLLPLSLGFALAIGVFLGVIQYLKVPLLRQAITIYVGAMRGIPPLVWLLIIFFGAGFASPMVSAVVALSVYHGGYITDIVRGGIESIQKGQFEAARSVALNFYQVMRYVVLPQVWRSTIPSIAGQSILLVKDIPLASAIGVMEVLVRGRYAIQQVGSAMFIYFLVGLFYFILCYLLERLSVALEKRYQHNSS